MQYVIELHKADVYVKPFTRRGKFVTSYTRSDFRSRENEPERKYRITKGTDEEINREIVKKFGVKVEVPKDMQDKVNRALAHILSDYSLSFNFKNIKVEVKPLQNRFGVMKDKLYIDEETARNLNAGFIASIIRHELEHKILTKKGIASGKQENMVRYTAGLWALNKYEYMAKTNPEDAEGFKIAAIEQGLKVK
jgi:hypothetical protein